MEAKIKNQYIDQSEFEDIFKSYFPSLTNFAKKYVSDIDVSKEIVHDIFIKLWEKRSELDPSKSLKSYLFTSVHNKCLNYIRDHKKFDRSEYHLEKLEENNDHWDNTDKMEEAETEVRIKQAIEKLPEKCKEVFILSRFEGLKYAEISQKLGIAVKTVETQISKALKILREELADIVTILFVVCLIL